MKRQRLLSLAAPLRSHHFPFPYSQLCKQADGAGVALSLESKDVKALAAAEQELVHSIESKLVVARVADAHSFDYKRE